MANTKTQTKRVGTDQKRMLRNKSSKSELKSAIKAVELAVNENDAQLAQEKLVKAVSLLDASISKNLHHKNYVARQKSRLTKAVNAIK